MNNSYQTLQEALDKATQKGAFNLQETVLIANALRAINADLQELTKCREEAKSAKSLESAKPEKK